MAAESKRSGAGVAEWQTRILDKYLGRSPVWVGAPTLPHNSWRPLRVDSHRRHPPPSCPNERTDITSRNLSSIRSVVLRFRSRLKGIFGRLLVCPPPGYGEGGIRTHEGRKTLPVFETGSFNHSDTSPNNHTTQHTIHASRRTNLNSRPGSFQASDSRDSSSAFPETVLRGRV